MRQLLRRREIVNDDWLYADEVTDDSASALSVIIPLAELRANADAWVTRTTRIGLKLAPVDRVEDIIDLLPRLEVIAIDFPGPSEGRGYTAARLLRERYGYTGELRATGAVKQDQIFLLARCGFDSFQIAAGESLDEARAALHRFTVAYQPSSDRGGLAPEQRGSA